MNTNPDLTYVGSIQPHTYKEHYYQKDLQFSDFDLTTVDLTNLTPTIWDHKLIPGNLVFSDDGSTRTVLPLRLDLSSHSPTGFNWGYAGSGPSQLSLAILAHFTNNEKLALKVYSDFKGEFIEPLEANVGFILKGRDIHEFLSSRS